MPKTSLQILLSREIDQLNIRIDRKILTGRSYTKEARIHKLLRIKLKKINRNKGGMVSIGSLLSV